MYLKKYQIRVVNELKNFLQTAKANHDAVNTARKVLPKNLRHNLNYVQTTFEALSIPLNDNCKNGLEDYYPRVVMKVPTGGGKTILAVETIREYQTLFAQKRNGLVVWVVPSETIYSQTVNRLRDKNHPYRQLLDQASGGNTIIVEKGQRLTTQDIDENLVVLFIMIQSVSRANNIEALKVFQDCGGYESFFPADNRYDLHEQLLEQVTNLDFISALGTSNPQIRTSMGNAIRVSNPFIIIDEIHKVFTPTAKITIDNLNPKLVLGLSATPTDGMNILTTVTGLELKDEDMIKLDMHLLPPNKSAVNDWKTMLREIKTHREELEQKAIEFRQNTGQYIRPIVLIQVERTGSDQRGRGYVHSQDVREYLIKQNINPNEIAIKSSSQNDIEDVNLFSSDCPFRWIITRDALREGWDCSYAYILGIIPNVNSNTGITQLVGRILRQPNAQKTGIKELDESYVYYTKGDTRQLLEGVAAGFKKEGLEDLITKMRIRGLESVIATKTVKIKKEFTEKYNNTLYLPVWVMMNEQEENKRRFSYDMDILPQLNLGDFALTDIVIERIKDALSEENKERNAFSVTIDDESKTKIQAEQIQITPENQISYGYITQRFSEVIDNSFLARKKANEWIIILNEKLTVEKVAEHFTFIVSTLTKELVQERLRQEEAIFLDHVKNKRLVLAVSDDKQLGFKVPGKEVITVTSVPNTYKYYLFDDVEVSAMNSLERKVGDILDKQEKILWWFRNKVSKQWYKIQGWQRNRIYPDFIAAKKKDNDEIELVYIIESKGEHLVNNIDSQYKKKVLDSITGQKKEGKIKAYQLEIPYQEFNKNFEAYLIEENKEEEKLRKLMK